MESIIIDKKKDGQKLDKLLFKYLNLAPKSFIYKMLRKKNIVLNDKKASGIEILNLNDEIKLWLSDATIAKFKAHSTYDENYENSNYKFEKERIIYEDDDILIYNKPVGLLSQKSNKNDISLNELFIQYLLDSNKITKDEFELFKPSICNRLDRNTSGLILMGKSILALQILNKLIYNRDIKKYYICIVYGIIKGKQNIKAYLYKDEKTNKVIVKDKKFTNSKYIETEYEAIYSGEGKTLLKIGLITGKSHQIRAHLSFIGHPIVGDNKYSNIKNEKFKYQLLHSYELKFPKIEKLPNISSKAFIADLPEIYKKILKDCKWEYGKVED